MPDFESGIFVLSGLDFNYNNSSPKNHNGYSLDAF